jgi:hypothetical protein
MYIESRLSETLSRSSAQNLDRISRVAPVIQEAMDAGGWICGGFPRAILMGHDPLEYLSGDRDTVYFRDIDVFMPTSESAEKVISSPSFTSSHPSVGGFCREWVYDAWNTRLNSSFKVQVVNHPSLIRPTLEATLDRFDFLNCQVAISGDRIIYPKRWHEIESQKLIKIHNVSSPFLGSRIMKYMSSRGMLGITEDSYDGLTEWLCRAANDKFEGFDANHVAGIENAVRCLRASGMVSRENLIFFIGKWLDSSHLLDHDVTYAESMMVDWAAQEISNENAS